MFCSKILKNVSCFGSKRNLFESPFYWNYQNLWHVSLLAPVLQRCCISKKTSKLPFFHHMNEEINISLSSRQKPRGSSFVIFARCESCSLVQIHISQLLSHDKLKKSLRGIWVGILSTGVGFAVSLMSNKSLFSSTYSWNQANCSTRNKAGFPLFISRR